MAQGVKIVASSHYVPQNIVTNDDLATIMDTNDEWIQGHTGIKTRHVSLQGENTSDLATKAAQQALAQTAIAPADIGLIIVTTFTPDGLAPSTAALVQRNLQAENAWAYDISTACAGFIFGLSTADKFLKAGTAKYALVISAEVNSKMMDFKDRASSVFFGDGAGAFILEASEQSLLMAEKMHTIGNEEVVHSGVIQPLHELSTDNYPKTTAFHQEGRQVFNEVERLIPDHITNFLHQNGLEPADVDYFIPHQANLRIIEMIAKKLGQPMGKFVTNVTKYGNTSSAGIAMGLDELRQNTVLTGKKVLLTGFGAGFTYGSILCQF
ncbi:beta-ketoacyl-ACP synthase III [Weissella thailandensis]|uniref:Beta-ketoacyl-[acyl-carrier-protein] synthase III n=1 Tax=Weissella thailandensis TaxID=89061 RepID=A0ABX9I2B0_9LACO|nr:beta-ketoacyl-ACP synthase III [Weissella thailandensis]NKY91656.1 ketoacyl-ACP synthase III [Weissella thailandensis]RDS58843.1 ketoacyl-ACP synthase III [Weissella thailandensis]GEP75305.1 beta-ketoacyl-[acyl-carrier-protein] synthase III [Weissella thailandensis]